MVVVGASSVDGRLHVCRFIDLLRPAVPRHPESPVGLLASAPDLIPGQRGHRFPPESTSTNLDLSGARHLSQPMIHP